jgi:lipopolysaccharide/colanic/teichoic acid biosynthesis glycosyltransferase
MRLLAAPAVDDVIEKLHYYIESFSPWLDVVVMLRTIETMLTGYGVR